MERLVEEGRAILFRIWYDGRVLEKLYYFEGEDIDEFLDDINNIIPILTRTHNTLKRCGCVLNPDLLKEK